MNAWVDGGRDEKRDRGMNGWKEGGRDNRGMEEWIDRQDVL